MSAATVTLPHSDYQRLQDDIRALKAEVEAKRVEIEDLKLGPTDSHARQLLDALNSSLDVTRFAIGNLPPMAVRGWPHKSLRSLAALLPSLPGVDEGIREVSTDWRLVADDCQKWEDARAEGKEHELLAHDNALKGASLDAFGPMLSGQAATPDD
jgi:hypothetical protein